jgi:hypothetical protein
LTWEAADSSFVWQQITSGTAYNDNQWHHIAAVIDASSGMSLYVDNALVGTNAQNYITNSSGRNLNIGTYSTSYFSGSIDEIGVWSRALSSGEVAQLYTSGSGNAYGGASCGFNH